MKKITLIVYMLIMISFMGISCKKNVNYDVTRVCHLKM